jgi:tRNA-dihydrouridine synthase B
MTFLLLAPPLEDNSDRAFRKLCYKHGADITFTEMARLKGIVRNNNSTLKKIEISAETPTIIQLLESNEKEIEKFLKTFTPPPGFKGFNLNMGCPSPNVTNIGLGCAFMKRIEKTNKLIEVFKKYKYPISLKIRLGLNKFEQDKKVYLNIIENTNPDYFILHARHGKQTYDNPADFSVYDEAVATGKKIVANGDIHTVEQIEDLKKRGLAGAMIGRMAIYNPGIFNVFKGKEQVPIQSLKEEYLSYAKEFNTPKKYVENVTTRMGRAFGEKKSMENVQG